MLWRIDMNSIIYYFSGSGNSYKIAKNLAEKLDDIQLIRITAENTNSIDNEKHKRIIIIFPVYYFSLPKMVAEFVERLNIDKDSDIYAVATCGGFTSVAFIHLKQILEKKGCTLKSTFKILMPDNYQILYSPASQERQQELIRASNNRVEEIASIINSNKTYYEKEPSALLKGIGEIGCKIFAPRNKDKNFWTDDNCNGCGICEQVCPAKDIIIVGNKPKWLNKCEQCLACMQWCPQKSIQYKKSTIKRGRYTHPEVKVGEMIISRK